MSEITFLDDVEVNLVRSLAHDDYVIQAAQVSVKGENEADITEERRRGLINYLVKHKHGSPFEHNSFTFYVRAPIFVFREFHRHRVGWSYNEISGRYAKLQPRFYMPKLDRKIVNIGSNSKPEFERGTYAQEKAIQGSLRSAYHQAWVEYEDLIDNQKIANEVARVVLPVGIYSEMYATCNARSLMAFLSLRTRDENATFLSRPQHEIELVARQMEAAFAEAMPLTYEFWQANGRVAP